MAALTSHHEVQLQGLRNLAFMLLGLGLLAGPGCQQQSQPRPVASTKPAAASGTAGANELDGTDATTPTDQDGAPPTLGTPQVTQQPPSPQLQSGAEDLSSEVPPSPANGHTQDVVAQTDAPGSQPGDRAVPTPLPESRERFLLYTAAGPLIVEVNITIDGKPYDDVTRRLIDQVLAAADTNGNTVTTWDEMLDSPQFKYGQYGNPATTDYAQRREMKRLYDINGNSRVDANEVVRYLTQNRAGSRAFSLTSSQQQASESKSRSPLRQLLDQNEDGRVADSEYEQAADRLLSRDADEDELLFVADFRVTSNLTPAQQQRRRRTTLPPSARLLGQQADFEQIRDDMKELYSSNYVLTADSFRIVPALFQSLNQDGDEEISDEELARLNEVEPQIKLTARFGKSEPDSQKDEGVVAAVVDTVVGMMRRRSEGLQLTLDHLADSLEQQKVSQTEIGNRITITFPRLVVTLSIDDQIPGQDFVARAKQQIDSNDEDKNGYLDMDEFPENFGGVEIPFAAIDTDEDEKIYPAEAAVFLRQQQAARSGQVSATAAHDEDAWFTALDTDHDGRLNSREIAAAPTRLRELDKNENGRITSGEIPDSMSIVLSRGNNQQLNVPPAAVARPQPPADQPRWFTRMDSNNDGDISPREFLGEVEQFRQLDADQDGFISAAEALPQQREQEDQQQEDQQQEDQEQEDQEQEDQERPQ